MSLVYIPDKKIPEYLDALDNSILLLRQVEKISEVDFMLQHSKTIRRLGQLIRQSAKNTAKIVSDKEAVEDLMKAIYPSKQLKIHCQQK